MSEFDIRWTSQKIAQRLALIEPLVYQKHIALSPLRYRKLDSLTEEPPTDPNLKDRKWEAVVPPTYWSEWETNFILRAAFKAPTDIAADVPLVLHLPLGELGAQRHPEALAYIDGRPYAGIDRHHHEILLTPEMRDGKEHHLALAGWTSFAPGATSRPYLPSCDLAVLSQPTRDFIALARTVLSAADSLPENDPARGVFYNALEQAFRCLDLREPLLGSKDFYGSVPGALQTLRAGAAKAGAPRGQAIYAAGHAHIDVAWLWTLNHTRQKARRTFYSVLRFMEQYPEYHFTQSQPQLYDFVRKIDPGLFEQIKERVTEGRWEATGGMWVEADCNLTGSESLARQFLVGRQFFREAFGPEADTPVLWLPDVFGYAWNLPQLIREAGLEYFFTIKLGWNQYNRIPYDSFWWQGLDGTRVLTHFSTTPEKPGGRSATYNADTSPEKVLGTWNNFQQKELVDAPLLISYGHGDGGGGPERAQIENVRELKAFPMMPQVKAGKVIDFFRELDARAGKQLPVWNGELYLEYHRGTYTSQARNKRGNRKSEFALHDAEFLSSQAAALSPDFAYPYDDLKLAWELVLLNQFHDILPGSSIHDVYVESQQQYREVAKLAEKVRENALNTIAQKTGGSLLVANPTGFARRDLAFYPGKLPAGAAVTGADGKAIEIQPSENGAWLDLGVVAPMSVTALQMESHLQVMKAEKALEPALAAFDCAVATSQLLENECLRVEINPAGDITRIFDKVNRREVLPDGKIANQWIAFEDRPMYWDAWDVDIFYEDKSWLAEPAESIRVVDAGPLRASIEIKRKILNSSFTQTISLTRNSPRLDFETVIDWRERHILLKAAFPVDVLATSATYEIQWGNVQRPTHRNTSWDWARFETAAHKWVDLSEGGYGVSLMNDCKYGHDVRDNVIRLSLLRAPTSPDPEADQGEQRFAYSLMPHAGNWNEETVAEAYALNDPMIVYKPEKMSALVQPLPSLFALDQPNLVLETVKRAEDGDGWIVRLYESQRKRGVGRLQAGFPVSSAWKANILEENQERLLVEDGAVLFPYKPYQIITLRIEKA